MTGTGAPSPRCGRIDEHPPHRWSSPRCLAGCAHDHTHDCPGRVTVEGAHRNQETR